MILDLASPRSKVCRSRLPQRRGSRGRHRNYADGLHLALVHVRGGWVSESGSSRSHFSLPLIMVCCRVEGRGERSLPEVTWRRRRGQGMNRWPEPVWPAPWLAVAEKGPFVF